MSFKEVNSERRQDWHQTSAGVGHHYRPGYYFPASDFKTFLNEPIPATLATQDNITRDQKYETTSGSAHDRKYPGGGFDHPIYKKAPGHWKVNYVKDLAEKRKIQGYYSKEPYQYGQSFIQYKLYEKYSDGPAE